MYLAISVSQLFKILFVVCFSARYKIFKVYYITVYFNVQNKECSAVSDSNPVDVVECFYLFAV